MKNNVTRLLDHSKIEYTVFELPPEKLGAEATAGKLGVPLEKVSKPLLSKEQGVGNRS